MQSDPENRPKVLTEESAYSNRWRKVSPVAKALFSTCGMVAAFAAASPRGALTIASILSAATVFGAAVPFLRYLRVAAPPLLFLLTSCMTLLVSLNFGEGTQGIHFQLATTEFPRIYQLCSRSLACLTALLFLALTTPLTDIIGLLRSCRTPETVLDLMSLCYRTLFVLSESVHVTIVAQSARLGYASPRHSLRSLGSLTANLAHQVWQRSRQLHLAAEARGNDGPLRFLKNSFPDSRQSITLSLFAGSLLILLAVMSS